MIASLSSSSTVTTVQQDRLREPAVAALFVLVLFVGSACSRTGSDGGSCPAGATIIPIEVTAGDWSYRDRPVVAPLGGVELPESVASWADAEVQLAERGDEGSIADESVPFQLDRLPSSAVVEDTTQLVFLLEGQTAPKESRNFRLCVGGGESGGRTASDPGDRVRLAGTEKHEEQESFVVRTDSAEYFYHRRGAGFASLHDVEGRDWISYNPGVGEKSGSGSGGKYRGLPNMGYPEGYAHPGFDTSRTEVLADGPLRVSLFSESSDGKMQVRWDVYPEFARLTVLKMRPPYWFLYEGTPGGELELQNDYWVRSGTPGRRQPAAEEWTEDLAGDAGGEWAYVGDEALGRVLFLAHHSDDEGFDSYWPMNEEMTVFGFGRRDLEKFMRREPNRFSVGFLEARSPGRLADRIRSVYNDPVVAVGSSE